MTARKVTKRQWLLLAGGAGLAAIPMGVLAPIAAAGPIHSPPGVHVPKGQLKPGVHIPQSPTKPANPGKIVSPVKPKFEPKKVNPEVFKPHPKPKPLSPLQQFLTNMGSSDLANKL